MRVSGSVAAIGLLALGHLVVDLFQGTVPALLPVWKQRFHLPYAAAGSIVLALQVSSSIVQPLFGVLGDRWQSRWWLSLAVLVAGAGTAAAAAASSFAGVLAGVVIGGLGVALYHPEGARRAHQHGGSRKATAQSGFVLGGNVGMALGPALVALWSGLGTGWLVGYLLAVGLSAAAVLAARSRWLAGELAAGGGPDRRAAAAAGERGGPGHSCAPPPVQAFQWRALAVLGLVVVLRSWVHHGLQALFPLHLVEQGMARGDVQTLLSLFLLAGALGTAVGGPAADAVGRKPVIVASMAFTAALLWGVARTASPWRLVLLVATGFTVVSTFSVATVMAQELLPGRVGTATGIIMGATVGMGGVGATLLGWAADRWGVLWVLQRMPLLPLAAVALALTLPATTAAPVRRPAAARAARP
ncbi:MAG TPA: MFS transporter [Limnochordales bacterium]